MIAGHDRVSLRATVDDSTTSPDVSVSLGLIVTELVINALKHAFPGRGPKGSIEVDYKSLGKSWTMMVSDNGVGMTPVGDRAKPSLGTGIVDALSKQLGAGVTVTANEPGTRVSVVHP